MSFARAVVYQGIDHENTCSLKSEYTNSVNA